MARRKPVLSRNRLERGVGRKMGVGCAGARARVRSRRLWRVAMLSFALVWPATVLADCPGEIQGIHKSNVCCPDACGTCGGDGCSDRADPGDCCIGDITDANELCSDKLEAPCVIDSTVDPTPTPSSGAPQMPQPSQAPFNSTETLPPTTEAPTVNITAQPPSATAEPMLPASPTNIPIATPAPMPSPSSQLDIPPVAIPTIAPAPTTPTPIAESSVCSEYSGIDGSGICCPADCPVCGGTGCGENSTAERCCASGIEETGIICGVNGGTAPCSISTSPVPASTTTPTTLAPLPRTASPNAVQPTPSPTMTPLPTMKPSPTPTHLPSMVSSPSDAPLVSLAPPTPGPSPSPVDATTAPESEQPVEDPLCSDGTLGYQQSVVCCPVACGQCGGAGCENINGTKGESDCCSDRVMAAGIFCNGTDSAPCIIGTVQEVDDLADDSSSASILRIRPGGGGGGISGWSSVSTVIPAGLTIVIVLATRAWWYGP